MRWITSTPAWDEPNEGGGGDAAAPDAATTLYPDDKPAGAISDAGTDANKAAGETPDTSEAAPDALKPEATETGEWKPYADDPAKTAEENDAARAENDAKHPINQVPEDGKYALTMPEGVELDAALLDALGPVMKDLNLSNGHAQMLADKFIEAQTAAATKRTEEWAQTITGWADKAKADPEMGGAKWDATIAAAISARDRFGTPELNAYLEASGAGNHPEVIRLMAKVGAMIGEDIPAISDNPTGKKPADPVVAMYPNDQPKGK